MSVKHAKFLGTNEMLSGFHVTLESITYGTGDNTNKLTFYFLEV